MLCLYLEEAKCLDEGEERRDDAHHMHKKRESRRDGHIYPGSHVDLPQPERRYKTNCSFFLMRGKWNRDLRIRSIFQRLTCFFMKFVMALMV